MASTTLVDFPLDAGWRLLDLLDAAEFDFQIAAAFWHYDEEREEWRFHLASPRVDTDGPFALYGRMQPLLDALSPDEREGLQLGDIVLVRPDQRVVHDLTHRYGLVQGKRGGFVRRSDLAREGAFIYRLS